MSEHLTNTPDNVVELHGDKSPEYSAEELKQLEGAAEGATTVLERAIEHGDYTRYTTETGKGTRGVIESPVPDGHVEATFDGSRLETIVIGLADGPEIGITFNLSGKAEVTIDGTQVNPAEIPAVASAIEHIQQFQAELAEQSDAEAVSDEVDESGEVDADDYKHPLAA